MRVARSFRLIPVSLLLAAGPPSDAPPGSVVEHVSSGQAVAVLGRTVADQDGKNIGRLVDVLVDPDGKPAAAVIDFGGFLGVGSRKIAVRWGSLHFIPTDQKHPIVVDMTPDQIKSAPEYSSSQETAPVVAPAQAVAEPDAKPPQTPSTAPR